MAYSNASLAEYLTNIATAYEIKNKTRFQIIAYNNAADTILTYPENIHNIWQSDPKKLDAIPNIGPSILKKIDYFLKFGKPHPALKTVFKNIHPAVFTFTKINGIGPINAYKLTQKLSFSQTADKALDQLVKYCQEGKVKIIPTFGEKSEISILKNTLSFLGRNSRMPLSIAQKLSKKIILYLQKQFPQVEFVTLGSLRRQQATVGDIDVAAASIRANQIIDHFLNYPDSTQTIIRGKSKASIRLSHDIHVDLMVKPPRSFGSLVQHFTGSRQHNILLRKHALKLGFSLSEYGIKDMKSGIIHRFDNETDLYSFLSLNLIPPPERVGKNELDIYKML